MGESERFRELTEVLRLVAHPIRHRLAGELCELLRRVALRRFRNRVDVEDHLHDLIVGKLHLLVSADTLAYAIRALDNCLRTSERRARRCDSTDDEADKGAGDPPRPRAKMLADSHTPADDRLAEHQEVRGLLGSLAAEDAQLLERVVAGESREDLAAELGLKRCAIDKRYSRLRAALRAEAVR